jgi:mRNA interferase RelE/StbE
MTPYEITIARSAVKEYRGLPASVADKVRIAIDSLAIEPRPAAKSKKLRASGGLFRLRVGDYRVVYSVDDGREAVDIIHIRHRKDAYRDL